MSKTEEKSAEVMQKVSDEEELYNTMEDRMNSESQKKGGEGCSTYQWSTPPTCMVPESLRKLKPLAYAPRVVSIGPLHQKKARLTAFQNHKFRYMHSLFDRTAISQEVDAAQTLRECVHAMFKAVPDAKSCYGESLKEDNNKDTDVELANTLLVDGCFILELLFRFENKIKEKTDPVFMNNLALGGITRDLLLLENQIPFFVLQQLFERTLQKIHVLTLTQYVVRFFRHKMIFSHEMTETNIEIPGTRYDHILHFLHNYYKPESKGGIYPAAKYSATQLHRTGVKFKASEGKDYYLQVRFQISTQTSPSICNLFSQLCISPCLELPSVHISDHTESFLRNLIAYEQFCLSVRHYITSYAFLMDTLINSKEDIEFLENEGVLQNHLGASEDASDLFHNLCKEISMEEFYFSDQWKELNKYCNLYCPKQLALHWSKYLASLKSTYFSSPWSIISLIGALILFGLTAVQTFYTVKSYFRTPN